MAYTFEETVTLYALQCASCSVTFAIPQKMEEARRQDHQSFSCPNGHSNHYPAKSQAEIYKAKMETEQREAAALRERAIVAERAQRKAEQAISRHKKRAAAGVCPCCNRTVAQLAAHMKSKHAEFRELQGLGEQKQLPEKIQ